MAQPITICKKPGIKNCVRISKEEDIPEFLKEIVKVEGEEIVYQSVEGEGRCPLSSVLAFEKLENGKMNAWNKANWATTTVEKDGVFYELPKLVKAILLDEDLPEELVAKLGDKFVMRDGKCALKTDWGVSEADVRNGYLIVYGTKEDGSLDANILTVGTPSFENYYVVNENGGLGEKLSEHHAKTVKNTRR